MSEKQTGILKSSLGVAFATMLSRALGLVRVMFEARALGGGAFASAWMLAFAIPNLFRRMLGEGALGNALIPTISQAEKEYGPERVRRDLGIVFVALSALLAIIVVIVSAVSVVLGKMAGSDWAGEFATDGTLNRFRMVFGLLPLLMPYAFFICLVGAIGAVLNTCKQFVLPALGALLLNFFLISGLAWGYWHGVSGQELGPFLNMLSYLVLASGAVQLAFMLLLLWKYGRFPMFSHGMFHNNTVLRQLWKLVLPGILGASALQLSFLADRLLAICVGPQAVPALTNVDRIIDLPIGIFAISLGGVLMASMARSAANGELGSMSDDLYFSRRHVIFVCVPMAVTVMFFWRPIISMLCLGGNYTESDLEATRYVAIFYGAGIPLFCSIKVILPMFYSRKDMKFPFYSSLIAIAVNICLNLILMWPLKQGGIALATVIGSLVNNEILLRRLRKEGFDLHGSGIAWVTIRCTAVAGLIGWGMSTLAYPQLRAVLTFRYVGEFPAFLTMLAAFTFAYVAINALLGAAEPREIRRVLSFRIKAK
ncbi:MAG: murein biosynthesis integral membrane protein MurJ [Victivallaceae bacterium]|nr:murein biosynthesis integral membrane protein MurJ [Victivallaceae bacterium]